jgi:hypothetical protein
LALEATKHPIQEIMAAVSSEVQRSRQDADHSPSFNVQCENTSTSQMRLWCTQELKYQS